MLRKALGGVKRENGGWRRQNNCRATEDFWKPGCGSPMCEESAGGRKKRGPPKKRWLDVVVTDVRRVGVYARTRAKTKPDGELL